MKKTRLNVCLALAIALMSSSISAFAQTKFEYPQPKKVDQTDDYFGTKVADPYRWMEDPDSADSRQWIEAENKVTNAYLATIPERQMIKDRLTKIWNYEKISAPSKHGEYYFYTKNDGLQNQSVYYITKSIKDPGKVFFDPNKLSTDGTVALNGSMRFTDDGKLVAIPTSSAGSDMTEWKIMEVETGKYLPDMLEKRRQGISAWSKDNKGFYYSAYPKPNASTALRDQNYFQKLYYHKLGTPNDQDVLVYERPDDKEFNIGSQVTEDGDYLILTVGKGTRPQRMVYYKSLKNADAPIVPLIENFDASYDFIGNDGETFYFETNKTAPLGKIVAVKLSDKTWKDLIPESKETLRGVNFINNQLVLNYLKDAYSQIKIYDLNGKLVRDVQLPGIGSAGGFGGERKDTETFYSFSSYNAPPTTYRYDMKTGKSELFRQAKVDFDPNAYEVKQVFYNSKDGTKVPMFIVHKKGLKLDGTNPTLLYGYGGFNIAQTPGFSAARIVWLEMGGVYAVANLRGGSEYGDAWWKAGIKDKKQNVFDDFIAAGEYLVKEKYTSPAKLAVQGGSNGGLLVGAVVNQRPDLFGAALPAVGVMDMLRFQKFTIGWGWTSDYGSSDNKDEFPAIYAYSPLHNIKKGTKYPAVMVTTSDHDDRVVPAHSFKYTATLQEANASDRPVLIRIETNAGHGAGKPTSKQIEEVADTYSFLVKELGMKVQ